MFNTFVLDVSRPMGPTPGDVELLCVLHAIGGGLAVSDLPPRLGLSPELAAPLRGLLDTLAASGWVALEGARITLTREGRAHLEAALDRWLR